eukprot:m51a1_g11733 hypothetical protein (1066) ;mRNA; r:124365-128840
MIRLVPPIAGEVPGLQNAPRKELVTQILQLQASLKAESAQRDQLEETNREQEKSIRSLEMAIERLRGELREESQERDKLDRAFSQKERARNSAHRHAKSMVAENGSLVARCAVQEKRVGELERELSAARDALQHERAKSRKAAVDRDELASAKASREEMRQLRAEVARLKAHCGELSRVVAEAETLSPAGPGPAVPGSAQNNSRVAAVVRAEESAVRAGERAEGEAAQQAIRNLEAEMATLQETSVALRKEIAERTAREQRLEEELAKEQSRSLAQQIEELQAQVIELSEEVKLRDRAEHTVGISEMSVQAFKEVDNLRSENAKLAARCVSLQEALSKQFEATATEQKHRRRSSDLRKVEVSKATLLEKEVARLTALNASLKGEIAGLKQSLEDSQRKRDSELSEEHPAAAIVEPIRIPVGIDSPQQTPSAEPPAVVVEPGTEQEEEQPRMAPRLIELIGRRRVRAWLVATRRESLHSDAVFILDAGDVLVQWNGFKCNRLERSKAVDILAKINRTRGCRAKVVVVDENEKQEPDEAYVLWKELGGKGPVSPARSEEESAQLEAQRENSCRLLWVRGEGSELQHISGKLVREMLETSECYILDCGSEIYAWIGKNAPPERRSLATSAAQDLFQSLPRPEFAEVVRCNQGAEPFLFTEKFANWPDDATLGPTKYISNIAESKKQDRIDVAKMVALRPPDASWSNAEESLVGLTEVWRVKGLEKVEVPKERYGQFHSGHSYIILFSYNLLGGISARSYMIYFWQGVDSPKIDQGTAAAIVLSMAKKCPGAQQVRLMQSYETPHFCKLLGHVVVHSGHEGDPATPVRMYHVRGVDASNTTAIEIAVEANGPVRVVVEGSEPEEFWGAVGGTAEYASPSLVNPSWTPKAFVFTTRTGVLGAEPLWRFTQQDLKPDAMILFDLFSTVFIWTGAKTKDKYRKIAVETGTDYARFVMEAEHGRKVEVFQISDGSEPLLFTSYFHGWRLPGGPSTVLSQSATNAVELMHQYSQKYTLEELKDRKSLPEHVDRANLERWLKDDEFERVFGMTPAAFAEMPEWKRLPLKKSVGLF